MFTVEGAVTVANSDLLFVELEGTSRGENSTSREETSIPYYVYSMEFFTRYVQASLISESSD